MWRPGWRSPIPRIDVTTFDDLDLIEPVLRALDDAGYREPTPIQAMAIPSLFDGRDMLGIAQTGTGKTAAFSLPVIQLLHESARPGRRPIRALVVSPTRELAAQIDTSFGVYSKYVGLRHHVIFGGVKQHSQVEALRKGLDALVATPGRLLDLHQQGHVDLSEVEFFVLDEADRMLDMGFINDIRRIIELLPERRQNLLFSATMPPAIARLARTLLHEPVRVEVTPQATTVERIEQSLMYVQRSDKRALLEHLVRELDIDRALVFSRTKHGANRIVKHLEKRDISAAALHGNKSQNARERALGGFRDGSIRVLVATDVASRGIDVDGVSHVINFDLPHPAETYVHRIGRTGRAGRDGVAVSFCDETEAEYRQAIEKLTGQRLRVDADHPFHSLEAMAADPVPSAKKSRGRRGGGGSRRGRGGGRRGGGRR